jgi:uncharacterized membrane protein YtjA (UPF0391 family)
MLALDLWGKIGGKEMSDILYWAIIALVVSLVAGALGFSGVAAGAGQIAKILFGIFLVIAVILFCLVIFGIRAIF